MKAYTESLKIKGFPDFLNKTELLLAEIQKKSVKQLKEMWQVKDKLAQLNYQRFAKMNLEENLTPAIYAYQGQVYKHINPEKLNEDALNYLARNLRIISGFYGLVEPLNGIVPYRLEMSNKLQVQENKNLYEFWGDLLYKELTRDNDLVINLASQEYSKVISEHLHPDDNFIDIEFVKEKNDKIRQLGMLSKMARGELVHFMAENNVKTPEAIKEFRYRDLAYSEKYSQHDKIVFLEQV